MFDHQEVIKATNFRDQRSTFYRAIAQQIEFKFESLVMISEDVVVIFDDGFVFFGFKKNVVIQFVLGFFLVMAVMVHVIFLPVD